jgi:KUP system potassium uptake protein
MCIYGVLDEMSSKRLCWYFLEHVFAVLILCIQQELEDSFDQENKKKLTRVVFNENSGRDSHVDHTTLDKKITFEAEESRGRSHSPVFIAELSKASASSRRQLDSGLHQDELGALYVRRSESDQLLKVERIPSLAIVHKLSEGKGVPHAFSVFVRQFPALPRVVVSHPSLDPIRYTFAESPAIEIH